MTRSLNFKNYTLTVNRQSITITNSKKEELTFPPGNSERIRNAFSFVWSMSSLDALPSSINCDPLEIKFKEDGTIEALDDPNKTNGFTFAFKDCDTLVDAVDQGMAINRDIIRHTEGPQYRGASTNSPDIIEGR